MTSALLCFEQKIVPSVIISTHLFQQSSLFSTPINHLHHSHLMLAQKFIGTSTITVITHIDVVITKREGRLLRFRKKFRRKIFKHEFGAIHLWKRMKPRIYQVSTHFVYTDIDGLNQLHESVFFKDNWPGGDQHNAYWATEIHRYASKVFIKVGATSRKRFSKVDFEGYAKFCCSVV